MSGGQDDASNAIDSSGRCELHKCKPCEVKLNEADLRWLLKECEGNEVLASQLRQRIEDAEDVMEPDLPSFNEPRTWLAGHVRGSKRKRIPTT